MPPTSIRIREIADEFESVCQSDAEEYGQMATPEQAKMAADLRMLADWLDARPAFDGTCPICGGEGRKDDSCKRPLCGKPRSAHIDGLHGCQASGCSRYIEAIL